MADIALQCRCGKVQGTALAIDPKAKRRCICSCDGCQAFAEFLGRKQDICDQYGGTDIYQLTPSQVRITQGDEQIRCVRLSPKGTWRWYCDCCKTPIGNTLGAGFTHLGLITNFVKEQDIIDEQLGPVNVYLQTQYANGSPPYKKVYTKFPPGAMVFAVLRMAKDRLLGRHRPHPFFNDQGQAIAEPTVLPVK